MLSQLLGGSPDYCSGDDWADGNASVGAAAPAGDAANATGGASPSPDDLAGFDASLARLRWGAYRVVMPAVLASGLLGNALNLAVLTRPALRGVAYVYLSGLATADLGVLLCVIPFALRLSQSQPQSYPAAVFHAHAELVAVNTFMAASVFIVLCLTVDRYVSVCWPTKFRSVHTHNKARLAIACSYLLAVAVSCPLAALKTVCIASPRHGQRRYYSFQENVTVTRSAPWLVYLWASETVVRVGPAVLLAVLNSLIIRKFRMLSSKRRRFRAASDKFRQRHLLDSSFKATAISVSQQNGLRTRSYYEEKRLVILLTAIVVLFFATMTPSALLSIKYSEKRDMDFGFQIFRAAANNLEVANFALNFYVYFLCSKEFRRVFLETCCGRERRAPLRPQPASPCAEREDGVAMEDFSRNGTTVRQSPDVTGSRSQERRTGSPAASASSVPSPSGPAGLSGPASPS